MRSSLPIIVKINHLSGGFAWQLWCLDADRKETYQFGNSKEIFADHRNATFKHSNLVGRPQFYAFGGGEMKCTDWCRLTQRRNQRSQGFCSFIIKLHI